MRTYATKGSNIKIFGAMGIFWKHILQDVSIFTSCKSSVVLKYNVMYFVETIETFCCIICLKFSEAT